MRIYNIEIFWDSIYDTVHPLLSNFWPEIGVNFNFYIFAKSGGVDKKNTIFNISQFLYYVGFQNYFYMVSPSVYTTRPNKNFFQSII